MERLKDHIKRRGFDYFLETREGKVALYRQELDSIVVGWEVFYVQRLPERTILGNLYPETEAMPSDEAWGAKGWTYYRKQDAEQKFKELSGR